MDDTDKTCPETVSPERCNERHSWIKWIVGPLAVLLSIDAVFSYRAIDDSREATKQANDLEIRVAVCESNHKDLKEFMESKFKTLRDYSRERRDEMRADQEELMAELTEQRKVLDKLLERRAGTD